MVSERGKKAAGEGNAPGKRPGSYPKAVQKVLGRVLAPRDPALNCFDCRRERRTTAARAVASLRRYWLPRLERWLKEGEDPSFHMLDVPVALTGCRSCVVGHRVRVLLGGWELA
jgi:hypothetical protein